MVLMNIFKEFDFFTKYFKISHFNRDLNSMKNKIIVIFLTFYLCLAVIRNLIILIIINGNQHKLLIELGDAGYLLGGKDARFFIVLSQITYYITLIVILIQYQMFDNQWIFKINEIYEQIKTQSMDHKLKIMSTKIIKLFKLAIFSTNSVFIIAVITIYSYNFIQSLIYIYAFLEFTLLSLFGLHLVIRNIFILIFICQKYIIIFSEINTEIIESFHSIEMNSNDSKSYFNEYYKCCDSFETSKIILERNYSLLLGLLSPITCYDLYYVIFKNETTFMDLFIQSICLSVIVSALILTLMICWIDIESKKAFHFIHGFAILNKEKHISFQVNFDK